MLSKFRFSLLSLMIFTTVVAIGIWWYFVPENLEIHASQLSEYAGKYPALQKLNENESWRQRDLKIRFTLKRELSGKKIQRGPILVDVRSLGQWICKSKMVPGPKPFQGYIEFTEGDEASVAEYLGYKPPKEEKFVTMLVNYELPEGMVDLAFFLTNKKQTFCYVSGGHGGGFVIFNKDDKQIPDSLRNHPAFQETINTIDAEFSKMKLEGK